MSYSIEEIVPQVYANAFLTIKNNQGYCFTSSQHFIEQSNDWHYLLRGTSRPPVLNQNYTIVEESIVPLVTSFHTGVHAYSGLYSILVNYFKKVKNSEHKFAIYKEIQPGLLELVEKIVGKSRLIYLESDVVYRFNEILLIPNCLHSFLENTKITEKISDFIQDKVVDKMSEVSHIKTAILKKPNSSVSSTMGTINPEIASRFCKRNKYTSIEPSDIGEVSLVNVLYNSEEVVFSWGTTFMKNFIYLSDKCTKVSVLVFGKDFYNEYINAIERGILVDSFKNAKFTYYVEPDLEKLIL